MLNRKLSILILATMMANVSQVPVKVVAETLKQNSSINSGESLKESKSEDKKDENKKAVVSKFELKNDSFIESYNKVFKVDNSKIELSNNGGNYPHSYLYKANDGNFSTHWETGKPNSSTFTNEVILNLKEKTTINRLVYAARQGGKGFAQKFKVYASKDDSNNFELLADAGYTGSRTDTIEIKFKPTEVKKVKFVFEKASEDWASASEFALYKQDVLSETINDLFTDGTMTKLKDQYNNINKINELEQQVNAHPLKEKLVYAIELAKEILKAGKDYSDRTFTLTQYGDTHKKAKEQLKMSTFGTDLQSTGIVAKPGQIFRVFVDAEDGAPLPKIAFTQQEGKFGYWKKEYDLKQGMNVITVPEIYNNSWSMKSAKGGAVYLINKYTPEQQGKAPTVRIEGGELFPSFKPGDDKEKFLKLLKEYKDKLDKDPENTVDIYEFNTKRVMYTGTAKAAYQVFVNEGVDVEESVKVWNDKIQETFDFAGLKDDPSDPTNDSTNVRTSIRLMQPYGAAYAYTDHIGVQRHIQEIILRTDANSINSILWGTIHEVGHQMDIKAREWGEVTNNMWSNNAYIKSGLGDRVPYNQLYKYLAPEKSLKSYSELDYSERLGMFWQLQLKKDTYWAELESLYRKRKPSPKNDQEKQDLLAEYSSEVIGMNLTHYFEKYGFNLSDECKERLKQYPNLGEKIWYLNTSALSYKGTGFKNKNTSLEVSLSKSSSGVKLTMNVDDVAKEDLLGYEVIKNGKVIGFTSSNTFTDSEAKNVDESINYEVVPYAKNLKTGDKVELNSLRPNISIQQQKITLKLNEQFNAIDYVKGFTHSGSDITSKVKVESNVDTTKRGNYEVRYTVEDDNKTFSKVVKVEVVSDYDYLSDFEWKSVSTVWGTPRRNSNIKGRVNGEIKTFEKGIGIHANGRITYDLSDKNYDKFEALLGVDATIQANNKSSVKFKIIADGKVLATTDVLKYYDNMTYLSVPVSGVKELVIEVSDTGNGNELDHCIIVNPKLTTNNAKPKITTSFEDVTMIKRNSQLDLMEGITAYDQEDGDITSKIVVNDGGFSASKPGTYNVTYTVTDSDSNLVKKERTIVVYGQTEYLSDKEWVSATSGWRDVVKDKAVGTSNKIKLKVNGNVQTFDKGIGAATNANIEYNLNGDYEYFTTYVGTDKNYNLNSTTIRFRILADGKEVYRSDVIRTDSNAEFVKLNVKGVKTLTLIADDVDGNLVGDFASWGDSKLYKNYAKPEIKGEKFLAFKVNETVDLLKGISASDLEDGDLTSKIKVTTDYKQGKVGVFDVKYSVTDSDGLTTEFTREVAITEEETYVSDLNWKSATIGSGSIGKDKSVRQQPIRILNENGTYDTYKKGLGTHSYSEITYDSTGYDVFDSWVGLDEFVKNQSAASVIFKVYVDGQLKAQTGIMTSKSPREHLVVDVRNSKEVKLVVDVATNGNSWDHANWADAKFRKIATFDTSKLEEVLAKAEKIDFNNYTLESIEKLENAINIGKEALKSANQKIIDNAIDKLNEVINSLVQVNLSEVVQIKDESLKSRIKETLGISGDVTIADMYKLENLDASCRWIESLEGLQYAKNLKSINIEYNSIKDLSPLKKLKKLTDINAMNQILSGGTIKKQDNKITTNFDIKNKNGEKIYPNKVVVRNNSTLNDTILDISECVSEDGTVSFETKQFTSGFHTLYVGYEDKESNYLTQVTYMFNNN